MKIPLAVRLAVFGGCDGLTVVLGLITGLAVSRQGAGAVWHASLAGGIAELVGMTAGEWLSDSEAGFRAALACGGAALAASVIPALPYTAGDGIAALALALVLVCAVAGVISWLRPEKGTLAVVQTYGVLVVAAVLSAAAAMI